ncbi:LWamide neuropeptides [Exaiptasia diaphana]|uniref:Uncharacterized protein n=1 Tax=Exaiptasia diaphana TaxID=2652724 RepID=A0A913WRR5_EXADI|nr:LWamide neuropeptides [Exaiptasia diaphana]KXJ28092.1 LWamide neuropeptide [Exaiptasia diaphana]
MALKGQLCVILTTLLLIQCQGKSTKKENIEQHKAVQTSGAERTGSIAGELSEISEERREAEPPQFGLWGKRQVESPIEDPQFFDKKANSFGLWGKRGNGVGLWGRSADSWSKRQDSGLGLWGRSANPGNAVGLWGKRQRGGGRRGLDAKRYANPGDGVGLWGKRQHDFGLWGRSAEPGNPVGLWGRVADKRDEQKRQKSIGLWGRSADPQKIGLWGR